MSAGHPCRADAAGRGHARTDGSEGGASPLAERAAGRPTLRGGARRRAMPHPTGHPPRPRPGSPAELMTPSPERIGALADRLDADGNPQSAAVARRAAGDAEPFTHPGQQRTETEESGWPLSSSPERALLRDRATPFRPDSALRAASQSERWMIHELQKRHHLYDPTAPTPGGPFEWLALMPHHGAPTRLLDFTASVYVAAFFALADAGGESAVWAVCRYNLQRRAYSLPELEYDRAETFKDEVNRHHVHLVDRCVATWSPTLPRSGVVDCEPTVSNRRLSLQQGAFLVPTNGETRFETNLAAAFGATGWPRHGADSDLRTLGDRLRSFQDTDPREEKTDLFPDVVKIRIGQRLRAAALRDLTRMNVTAESLFGGLARSIYQRAVMS